MLRGCSYLKNRVFLTFDIDWAPDHMVNHVIDLCLQYGVSATFFATHISQTIERLHFYSDFFEVGLHPNFMIGSTQGSTDQSVFNYCKKLVPNVASIRTHCLYQHGHILDEFNQNFGLKIVDSSIFMPGYKNILPFNLRTENGVIIRVPFFWADGYYLLSENFSDPVKLLQSDGCKVYMFHPIHIYQNTKSMREYKERKQSNKSEERSVGIGIATLFEMFLQHLSKGFCSGLMGEFLAFDEKFNE